MTVFGFDDYKTGKGVVFHNSIFHEFVWRDFMTISPTFWNSICLTYNFNSNYTLLMINGREVLNKTGSYSKQINNNNLSNPMIMLELSPGSEGQFSDLNLWSRPLSLEDLSPYFEGCNSIGSE